MTMRRRAHVALMLCGFLVAVASAFPLVADAATCPNLSRTLSFGSRGSDVVELQTFLIARGDLATGLNTGYYGRLTEAAVKKFQVRHTIVSSGTAATTGFGVVGPRTRAKIAELCRGGEAVSANLSAHPSSGSVPLSVTFSSAKGSHPRGTMIADLPEVHVDFGDGSQSQVIYCDAMKNHDQDCVTPIQVQHTYASVGTYRVQLTSVGVECYGSCTQLLGAITIIVTGIEGSTSANPKLVVFPTSGTAPLSVTFSAEGIANSWPDPRTGMMVSISDQGDRYIDFGDGSAHVKLVCYAAPPCRVSTTHIYQNVGTYRATLFTAGYYGIENDPVYRTRSDEAQVTVTAW